MGKGPPLEPGRVFAKILQNAFLETKIDHFEAKTDHFEGKTDQFETKTEHFEPKSIILKPKPTIHKRKPIILKLKPAISKAKPIILKLHVGASLKHTAEVGILGLALNPKRWTIGRLTSRTGEGRENKGGLPRTQRPNYNIHQKPLRS